MDISSIIDKIKSATDEGYINYSSNSVPKNSEINLEYEEIPLIATVSGDDEPTVFFENLKQLSSSVDSEEFLSFLSNRFSPEAGKSSSSKDSQIPFPICSDTPLTEMFGLDIYQPGHFIFSEKLEKNIRYPYTINEIDEYNDEYPEPVSSCEHAPVCPTLGHQFTSEEDLIDMVNTCKYSEEGCPIFTLKFENTEEKIDFSETKSITGMEIFSIGQHKGKEFTLDDLKRMKRSFEATKDEVKPPLKIGHSNDLAVRNGMPAVGWGTDMRISNGKLIADFEQVPETVYELIDKGAYKRVSIELLPQFFDSTGEKHEQVIIGVALLGADMPEVRTLKDVDESIYSAFEDEDSEIEIYSFEEEEEETINLEEIQEEMNQLSAEEHRKLFEQVSCKEKDFTIEIGGEIVDFEELSEAFNELSSEQQKTLLEESSEDFTSEETEEEEETEEGAVEHSDETLQRIQEQEQRIEELQADKLDNRVNSFVSEAIEDGRLLPSQKELVEDICDQETVETFSSEEESLVDMVEEFVNELEPQVQTEEYTSEDGAPDISSEEYSDEDASEEADKILEA